MDLEKMYFPIKNGDIPASYLSLPKGNLLLYQQCFQMGNCGNFFPVWKRGIHKKSPQSEALQGTISFSNLDLTLLRDLTAVQSHNPLIALVHVFPEQLFHGRRHRLGARSDGTP